LWWRELALNYAGGRSSALNRPSRTWEHIMIQEFLISSDIDSIAGGDEEKQESLAVKFYYHLDILFWRLLI
jgi:hypothetical protein